MSVGMINGRLFFIIGLLWSFSGPACAVQLPTGLSISLSRYSGRPNPSWLESNPVEISKISVMLRASSLAPQKDLWNFGCFSVENPNGINGIPGFLIVCKDGINSFNKEGTTLHDNGALYTYFVNSALHANVDVPIELRGDIDGNGRIDQADINELLQDKDKENSKSVCGSRCDLDNDGMITMLDARKLAAECTYSHCASRP